MDMLKSKEGLAEEVKSLRAKLQSSREQNSVLSDQLLLLQKECKNLLNSISGYEETNHKLSTQVARLTEKNSHLKKKLKQAVTACSDIKKQAESYISSIQARFYEQMSRMNSSRREDDTEASYSMSAFNHSNSFKYDSPAISVSERENDSSIARYDSEEIILAYTQEIRDKQTEISALSKSLENKTLDLENFKMNMRTLRDSFDKRIAEKDKMINALQQEVRILHEEINNYKKEGKPRQVEGSNEDYVGQIESLQNKLAGQSKKFENYIRTIANLEKQVQLQMVRVSELETSLKSANESITKTENEKNEFLVALNAAEGRVAELESLKIQQAKIINEQSAKLASGGKNFDESASVQALKRNIEELEEDNRKLIEANTFIQNYADSTKRAKDAEIAVLKVELSKLQEIDSPSLNKSLSEDKDNKYKDLVMFTIQALGESDPVLLLQRVKKLTAAYKDSPEDLKTEILVIFKEFSNKNMSMITRISNSVHKVNEHLEKFVHKLNSKLSIQEFRDKISVNQIRSYEITTVNECSEKEDESFEEDTLEIKLEQSARRIKELNKEINMLKDLLEQKDDLIHDLELKSDRLRNEKEKRIKENNDLHIRLAEAENELRTNKELFDLADKKKTAMINTLENRISSLRKDMEYQKTAVSSEKEELFDHIIRIEQESKTQSSWHRSQMEELKVKLKQYEGILDSIEAFLGSDFNGDHLESIKNITSKKRSSSFSFKIFKRSTTKSESGSKNGTPTGSEVLSPSASGTNSVDYMKMHKALEQEKLHNVMHLQQIEALRENIRHLEYESSRNTDSKLYQNLRNLLIEILKLLPIM